jgi:hypothetical protein
MLELRKESGEKERKERKNKELNYVALLEFSNNTL